MRRPQGRFDAALTKLKKSFNTQQAKDLLSARGQKSESPDDATLSQALEASKQRRQGEAPRTPRLPIRSIFPSTIEKQRAIGPHRLCPGGEGTEDPIAWLEAVQSILADLDTASGD